MSARTIQLEYLKRRIARALFGAKRETRRSPSTPSDEDESIRSDAIAASRQVAAAMSVLAYDGTRWVEGAVAQTQRAVGEMLRARSTGSVWLPSFVALGAADVAFTSSALARSMKGLELVGAAGGVGLIAASSVDLYRAETAEEVLDASSDFAWGVQGVTYLTAAPAAARIAASLGLVGAAVQISSGVLRITRGIRLRDGRAVKLGALDLSGGLLWAGWDVVGFGNPLFLGSYVVLMVGREAYANKEALQRWLAAPARLRSAT